MRRTAASATAAADSQSCASTIQDENTLQHDDAIMHPATDDELDETELDEEEAHILSNENALVRKTCWHTLIYLFSIHSSHC